ncbi:MAG: aldehyde dehydrogenase family protein [Bacteriovoracaceae bacterium]|nr:aldehyde dehydrogenase family protein [Bacteriovoracaceae bacterium]
MNPFSSQVIEMRHNWITSPMDYDERLKHLGLLRYLLIKWEKEISGALKLDLGKSEFESFATEIGPIIKEITIIQKNLKSWMKPKSVRTDFINLPGSSKIYQSPLGVSLIISPWNYPIQLCMGPLLGAISSGSPAIIKPSENSVNTSLLIETLINDHFDLKRYRVINGDKKVAQQLLDLKWDFIFFTGSTQVGKVVYQAAATNLTPVVLELGGKSPAIVFNDADLEVAAVRIAWGKFLNVGQTCIAPDYVAIHCSVAEIFKEKIKKIVVEFYGINPKLSRDYGRIINQQHFDRLVNLWQQDGRNWNEGELDRENRYMAPKIEILGKIIEAKGSIWEDEIFGPILPIYIWDDGDQLLNILKNKNSPLAIYIFTENMKKGSEWLGQLNFGGGCINDCLMHISNSRMPFGGVGPAGIGNYHGRFSFEAFSQKKPVLNKSTWMDVPLRYAPYKDKVSLIRKLIH